MDRAPLRSFIETAEEALARARGSLLLLAQGGGNVDLQPLAATLVNIAELARGIDLVSVAEKALTSSADILNAGSCAPDAYRALDSLAAVEAALLDATVVDEFSDELAELVDGSFDELIHATSPPDPSPQFTIDSETFDIFRTEGEELLAAISLAIDVLAASPSDQNALWDIRRSAHTFKGAAGIIGLPEAASLAHRMEDLLDRLVETSSPASTEVTEFLRGCVRSLGGVLDGAPANSAGLELAYSSAVSSLAAGMPVPPMPVGPAAVHEKANDYKPTVRVSLERLAEILHLSEEILRTSPPAQREVAARLHEKLVRVRLVRFGTLETRLARAVSNTAMEEGKRAVLEIETPDIEIDTLIVDALVEPLIHLLKNAVVHGIELPEMRRMVGKHEFGLVSIRIEADSEAIVVMVADDGAGISTAKLKERAIEKKLINAEIAAEMTDRDAYRLLFDNGLTTAEKLDLNAGRGIGMGIVKECIESRGGSVHVESAPQLGTTFTLMLPVSYADGKHTERQSADQVTAARVSTDPLILIVDDSATIRRHNQLIAESCGFRCITAVDGAEALEMLLNGSVSPDLILSDVEMPHVDGWQLLEYIKTDDHLSGVPVVLVTSLSSDGYKQKATALGAADYIVKPLTEQRLDLTLTLLSVAN